MGQEALTFDVLSLGIHRELVPKCPRTLKFIDAQVLHSALKIGKCAICRYKKSALYLWVPHPTNALSSIPLVESADAKPVDTEA
ncbi:hypothetical protein AAY473_009563 [Plecturocebus cupreus]